MEKRSRVFCCGTIPRAAFRSSSPIREPPRRASTFTFGAGAFRNSGDPSPASRRARSSARFPDATTSARRRRSGNSATLSRSCIHGMTPVSQRLPSPSAATAPAIRGPACFICSRTSRRRSRENTGSRPSFAAASATSSSTETKSIPRKTPRCGAAPAHSSS